MPPILGNLIVIAILIVVVGLAVRSIWRSRKSGGCGCGCDGCAGGCAGCPMSTSYRGKTSKNKD